MIRIHSLAARERSIPSQLQKLVASPTPGHPRRASSTKASPPSEETNKDERQTEKKPTTRKTTAQLDEELRLKMEGISGDGGAAGVEYEDGKAEGLKRGVKSNMFRVI